MKKFNFKSIFAIAVVAVASVFGLSSCDKNDDMIIPEAPSKEEVKAAEHMVFVSNTVLDLGDVVLKVNNDGKTDEYHLSAGTAKSYSQTKDDGSVKEYPGKEIVVKNLKKGATVTPEFIPNESAIAAALPAGGHYDVAFANSANKFLMPGLANEKVVEYINRRLALMKYTAQ